MNNNNIKTNFGDDITKFTTIGKKRNAPFSMGYKVYGNGPEKIIFVAGLLSKGNSWNLSVGHFKKQPSKYTICYFDHCGIGESSYSSLSTINDLASDTSELIEHLNWNTVNVIGTSMGAVISYELSLIAPERIKTLNLSSFAPVVDKFLLQEGIRSKIKTDIKSILKNELNVKQTLKEMFSDSFLQSPSKIKNGKNIEFIKPLMEKILVETKKIPLKIKLAHMKALASYKFKPSNIYDKGMLQKRSFPIAMFFGTSDYFIDWKRVVKTYDAIGANQVYICKDAGHALYVEDAETFNNKTEQFFSFNNKSKFLIQESLDFTSKTYTPQPKFEREEIFSSIGTWNSNYQFKKTLLINNLYKKISNFGLHILKK